MSAHVYFDLDGTLTDPFEGISKCILYALDELGFPHPSHEYLLSCIGPSLYDTFPELVGEALTLRAIHHYRERFNEVGWRENIPYPDIYDALAAIRDTGCTMYVATSKPRVAAKRIVEHFDMDQYFDRVFGSELDGTHAKKADLLRFAIEDNPRAASMTMIGDRKYDLVAAITNNMTPVGVAYGYGSVEELEKAGAIAIAKKPGELHALVS